MSEQKCENLEEKTSPSSSDIAEDLDSSDEQESEVPEIGERTRDVLNLFSLQKRIKLTEQNEYENLWASTELFSEQKEYENLLDSTEFIRHKFLVKMPPDFYYFWKFLNELKPNTSGDNILNYMEETFKVKLVGPFEYVAGRFHGADLHEPGDYLRHWRFYYDPPEFQTVFVHSNSDIHYGYWRDDPQQDSQLLMARNNASETCVFDFVAGNVFDAFEFYLTHDLIENPISGPTIIDTIRASRKYVIDHNLCLDIGKILQEQRSEDVHTLLFHQLGMLVPYDYATNMSYRKMMVTEEEFKKILKLFESTDNTRDHRDSDMEKLQSIVEDANEALNEGHYSTALEVGIDLFCSGYSELHGLIQSLLIPAYKMLHRPQFLAILKAHLECRRKDINKLSIFEKKMNK